MRILIAHNCYQTPGGEDAVVRSEARLLEDHGEQVFLYQRSNEEIEKLSVFKKIPFFLNAGWSLKTYRQIKSAIQKFKPDVAHFHNIFFMISPSAYLACQEEGVPVIQSQHNFRLLCSNALFFRQGKVCEDCLLKRSYWPGVRHCCYRNSWLLSFWTASMLKRHWRQKTWHNLVDIFIMATEFTKQKYVSAGISENKIMVKPHMMYPEADFSEGKREIALYAGRLSQEKGVEVLLKAWEKLPGIPLKILGDGPEAVFLKNEAKRQKLDHVEFLGYGNQAMFDGYMRRAKCLIVPSVCYENFPRIVVEAYAYGVPVVASRLGSLQEIIEDYKTGFLFSPGDPIDLASKVRWLMDHPEDLDRMYISTRREFERKYQSYRNYAQLMEIYHKAIEQATQKPFKKGVSACCKN